MTKTVLLVDDESEIREVLAESLADMNLNFIHASDGRQALEMLESHSPDLVISDFNMPTLNGLELLKILREKNVMTPVIWLTGYADQNLVRESWNYGVFELFEKPVDFERFCDGIKAALELGHSFNRESRAENVANRNLTEYRMLLDTKIATWALTRAYSEGLSLTSYVQKLLDAEKKREQGK